MDTAGEMIDIFDLDERRDKIARQKGRLRMRDEHTAPAANRNHDTLVGQLPGKLSQWLTHSPISIRKLDFDEFCPIQIA